MGLRVMTVMQKLSKYRDNLAEGRKENSRFLTVSKLSRKTVISESTRTCTSMFSGSISHVDNNGVA